MQGQSRGAGRGLRAGLSRGTAAPPEGRVGAPSDALVSVQRLGGQLRVERAVLQPAEAGPTVLHGVRPAARPALAAADLTSPCVAKQVHPGVHVAAGPQQQQEVHASSVDGAAAHPRRRHADARLCSST